MNSGLAFKRVVVTRPAEQAASFCAKLRAAGANPIQFPTIKIQPMPDETRLRQVLAGLNTYDRAIFTSVNGVSYVWKALEGEWPSRVRVAAIGPATAVALQKRGVEPDFVPREFMAERIATGLGKVAGQAVLLLRAHKVPRVLADMLRARQALVTEVSVYQTRVNMPGRAAYAVLSQGFDVLTFTSASTVEGFASVADLSADNVVVACIGPVTAEAARRYGFEVDVIAREYTTDGLMKSLEDYFSNVQY